MRPPVLPNNAQPFFPPEISQWSNKNLSQIQAQSPWGFDLNLVLPIRPQSVTRSHLSPFGAAQQSRPSFDDVWAGSFFQNGSIPDTLSSPYTATSFISEQDSLPISHVPSLGTNPSLGTLSWESTPDVPEIYGASQWAGLSSFSSGKGHDDNENIEPDAIAQQEAGPDGMSSGMESQYGTSPMTINDGHGAQAPSWFDYGNQVTQPQGVPNLLERMSSFPHIPMPQIDPSEMSIDFQLFGNNAETQVGPSYGATHDPGRKLLSPVTTSPSSDNATQSGPWSGLTMELSPSSQSFVQYTPPSHSSPMNLHITDHGPQPPINHEIFMNLAYSNTASETVPQHVVPYLFPQPPAVYAVDETMEETEWDCDRFVMENGRNRAITPPSPRKKGVRAGHRPPEEAKRTAIRRKEKKTCLKCRVARIAVRIRIPHRTSF
jgi:hypothetical protein